MTPTGYPKRKLTVSRICLYCDKPFIAKCNAQRYCSEICQHNSDHKYKKKGQALTCVICGGQITAATKYKTMYHKGVCAARGSWLQQQKYYLLDNVGAIYTAKEKKDLLSEIKTVFDKGGVCSWQKIKRIRDQVRARKYSKNSNEKFLQRSSALNMKRITTSK